MTEPSWFKEMTGGLLDVAVGTFGETVEYRPRRGGGKYLIPAVFDENFETIDPSTEAVVSVVQPRLGIKMAEVPQVPEQGDRVRIVERFFEVSEVQEDGQGGAVLWLIEKDE